MGHTLRIEDEIRKELGKNEVKLWSAQPNPNKLFAALDIYLIPASVFMVWFIILMSRMMRWNGIGIFLLIPFALSHYIICSVGL